VPQGFPALPRVRATRKGCPGTGKTHLAIGLSIRACQAGHRVLFATAAQWVDRLAEAHGSGRLHAELTRLGRYPLIVIDEVGCAPRGADGPWGMRGPPPVVAVTG
jgi:DNA replication protein DnaC